MAQFIKTANAPEVYRVNDDGSLTHVMSADAFGNDWSQVQTVGQLPGFVQKTGDPDVYKVDSSGNRTYVGDASAFGNDWSKVRQVNELPAAPLDGYRKLIADWYSLKPATPGTFNYSPEQQATDRRSVADEYRPFYQEQVGQSNDTFSKTLAAAREGFSRRGMWGAAGTDTSTVDPATGLTMRSATVPTNTPGIQSGLRQKEEQNLVNTNDRANTAFGRSYTQAVAGGAQGREAEAQDVYQKTIRDPYTDQYNNWLAQLQQLQANQPA